MATPAKWWEADELVAPAPKATSSLLRRAVADPLVALGQGAVDLGESAVGIGSLLSGGAVGRGAQALGYDPERTKRAIGELYSPEAKTAFQAVEQAEGVLPTLQALAENPSSALLYGVRSLPFMGGTVAAARGAAGLVGQGARATSAARTAAGVAEGALTAGNIAEEIRRERPGDAAAMYAGAVPAGIGTALIGRLGGALEAGLATRGMPGAAGLAGGLPARVLKGVATEAAEEAAQSAQERAWTNLALERPWDQGVAKEAALGGVVGGLLGGAMGPFAGRGELAQAAAPPAVAPVVPPATAPAADVLQGAEGQDTLQGGLVSAAIQDATRAPPPAGEGSRVPSDLPNTGRASSARPEDVAAPPPAPVPEPIGPLTRALTLGQPRVPSELLFTGRVPYASPAEMADFARERAVEAERRGLSRGVVEELPAPEAVTLETPPTPGREAVSTAGLLAGTATPEEYAAADATLRAREQAGLPRPQIEGRMPPRGVSALEQMRQYLEGQGAPIEALTAAPPPGGLASWPELWPTGPEERIDYPILLADERSRTGLPSTWLASGLPARTERDRRAAPAAAVQPPPGGVQPPPAFTDREQPPKPERGRHTPRQTTPTEVDWGAVERLSQTAESREALRQQGFISSGKAQDLDAYGYRIVYWSSPRLKKAGDPNYGVIEYRPLGHGKGPQPPRLTARTAEQQAAVHRALGLPLGEGGQLALPTGKFAPRVQYSGSSAGRPTAGSAPTPAAPQTERKAAAPAAVAPTPPLATGRTPSEVDQEALYAVAERLARSVPGGRVPLEALVEEDLGRQMHWGQYAAAMRALVQAGRLVPHYAEKGDRRAHHQATVPDQSGPIVEVSLPDLASTAAASVPGPGPRAENEKREGSQVPTRGGEVRTLDRSEVQKPDTGPGPRAATQAEPERKDAEVSAPEQKVSAPDRKVSGQETPTPARAIPPPTRKADYDELRENLRLAGEDPSGLAAWAYLQIARYAPAQGFTVQDLVRRYQHNRKSGRRNPYVSAEVPDAVLRLADRGLLRRQHDTEGNAYYTAARPFTRQEEGGGDAESLRSDARPVRGRGPEPRSGAGEGRQDLQQPGQGEGAAAGRPQGERAQARQPESPRAVAPSPVTAETLHQYLDPQQLAFDGSLPQALGQQVVDAVRAHPEAVRASGDGERFLLRTPSTGELDIGVYSVAPGERYLRPGIAPGAEQVRAVIVGWVDPSNGVGYAGSTMPMAKVSAALREWVRGVSAAAPRQEAPPPEAPAPRVALVAPRKTAKQRYAERKRIDPAKDGLLAAIAKAGGIAVEEARAQGIDPAEFRRRGWGVLPVFSKAGDSFDGMAERLSQFGYLSPAYTANELLDKVDRALRGQRVVAAAGVDAQAEAALAEYEADQQAAWEAEQDAPFLLDEAQYLDNHDAGTRTLSDLAQEAIDAGADEDAVADLIERGALQGRADEDIARDLRALAPRLADHDAGAGGRDLAPAGVQQGARPGPAEAEGVTPRPQRQQVDFVGGKTAQEQVLHDARLAKDATRNRDYVPPSQGPGDLFAGPRAVQQRMDLAAGPPVAAPPTPPTEAGPAPASPSLEADDEEILFSRRGDRIQDYRLDDYDALPSEIKAIVDRVLAEDENPRALRQRLRALKGTPWAIQALDGALARAAVREAMAGREPTWRSALEGSALKASLQRRGEAALWDYLQSYGLLGAPAKPRLAIASSFLNCHPTRGCAEVCYATGGNYYNENHILKGELIELAVRLDPRRAGRMAAQQYKAAHGLWETEALRLFDKGDGAAHWLPFVAALNRAGVRVHVFSKRPEFLSQLSDFNLRLLSVDGTRWREALKHPDLRPAFLYRGREDNDAVVALAKAARSEATLPMVLPIQRQGASTKAAMQDWRGLPQPLHRLVCPVDSGKTVRLGTGPGEYSCRRCDKGVGVGCYFHATTTEARAAVDAVLAREHAVAMDPGLLELHSALKELERESEKHLTGDRAQHLADAVRALLADARRGTLPDAAGGVAETLRGADAALGGGGGEERRGRGGAREGAAPAYGFRLTDTPGPAAVEDERGRLELYDAPSAPPRKKGQIQLATRVKQVRIGTFRSPLTKVEGVYDAAVLLRDLGLNAQEQMVALVVDKEDRPLSVIRHSVGTIDGSQVYPGVLAGAIHAVRGASRVYLAHNHPSGVEDLSHADHNIAQRIARILWDTGVTIEGFFTVTTEGRAHDWNGERFDVSALDAAPRTGVRVPVTERQYARFGTLGPQVSNPASGKDVVRLIGGDESGVLLLNNRHHPVGWVPLAIGDMQRLRTGSTRSGASRLFRALSEANAAAAILSLPEISWSEIAGSGDARRGASNLHRFLKQADIRVLDTIYAGGAESAAEAGLQFPDSDPYFQRGTPGPGLSVAQARAVADRLTRHLASAPTVHILADARDPALPAPVARRMAREGIDARAFLYQGEVYVFAREMRDEADLVKTLVDHEFRHYGLRGVLGKRLNPVLEAAWRGAEHAQIRAFARDQGIDTSTARGQREAAEEYIVHLAESGQENNLLQRVFAAIREWLRRIGVDLALTDLDLRRLVAAAGTFVESGKRLPLAGLVYQSLRTPALYGPGPSPDTPGGGRFARRPSVERHTFASEPGTWRRVSVPAIPGARPGTTFSRPQTLDVIEDPSPSDIRELFERLAADPEIPTWDRAGIRTLRTFGSGRIRYAWPADKALHEPVRRALGLREADLVTDELRHPNAERVRFARRRPPWYFSAAGRFAAELPMRKATGAQWLAMLRKAPGVKPEELDWLGLPQWLEGQKSLPKEALLDFIARHQIRIEEVVKNERLAERQVSRYERRRRETEEALAQYLRQNTPLIPAERYRTLEAVADREQALELVASDAQVPLTDDFRRLAQAFRNAVVEAEDNAFRRRAAPRAKPRFGHGNLVLPGGTKYHELLLTLPQRYVDRRFQETTPAPRGRGYRVRRSSDGRAWDLMDPSGGLVERFASREDAELLGDIRNRDRHRATPFRSDHWSEANVLVHVRFDARTDAEGRQVLFLEEIQGDWHQTARRKGSATLIGYRGQFRLGEPRQENGRTVYPVVGPKGEYGSYLRRADAERRVEHDNQSAVPDAPFKGSAWVLLAVKRMLRWAVDHGYDRLAWTPGALQAGRYSSLSIPYDGVRWAEWEDGTWSLIFRRQGRIVHQQKDLSAAELREFLGAAVADRILAHEGLDPSPGLSQSVRVAGDIEASGIAGGQGMRAFYDRIVPQEVGKYVKRWGASVGQTDIPYPGVVPHTVRAWSVDLTDAMRESVAEGQPLFARKPKDPWTLPLAEAEWRARVLAPRVAAAYAAGDWHAAETLDAQLEALYDRLEHGYGQLEGELEEGADREQERKEGFADEEDDNLEADLASYYHSLYVAKDGRIVPSDLLYVAKPTPEQVDRANAEALREVLADYGWKLGGLRPEVSDEEVVAAARDAYEARARRGVGQGMKARREQADARRALFRAAGARVVDGSEAPDLLFARAPGDEPASASRFSRLPAPEALVRDYAALEGAPSEAEIREAARQYREVETRYRDTPAWMKAPNGEPTRLNERQWVLTRTPNFKRWFGDWENDPANASKAIDANGEPRVMYHGARSGPISTFDRDKGEPLDSGWFGPGHYFTPLPRYAAQYGAGRHGIYPVFLNLRNPIRIRHRLGNPREGADAYAKLPQAQKDKADGVVVSYTDENAPYELVVSGPNQIKSGVGNVGTFGETGDIRFARALDMRPAARIARARALGFDPDHTYYHATSYDFRAFDPAHTGLGAHVGTREQARDIGGTHVLPVWIRKASDDQIAYVTDVGDWHDFASVVESLDDDGVLTDADVAELNRLPWYSKARMEALRQLLLRKGIRQLRYENQHEGGDEDVSETAFRQGGGESVLVLDPADIRSVFAAFGPDTAGEDDLLFARRPVSSGNPDLDSALAKAGIAPDARNPLERTVDAVRDWWGATRTDLKDRILEGTFDQFHGIQTAERRVAGNLPAEQSGYVAARLSTGTSAVLYAMLHWGAPRWGRNALEPVPGSKGLLEVLAPVKDDLRGFFGWMIGRRARRLLQEDREHLFTEAEIAALEALHQPAYDRVAADFAAYKRAVLDLAEGAGLVNPATRAAWDHADWIPFYRLTEEDRVQGPQGRRGLSNQSSGIRTLQGGTQALGDPLENLVLSFAHLVDASLKNHALRQTVTNLLADPNGVLEPLPATEFTRALVPRSEVKRVLREAGADAAVLATLPPEAFDGIAQLWSLRPPKDSDVIRVMEQGKARYFRVHDAALLRGLTAVNQEALGGLVKPLRAFKRLLTAAVTADPAFMLRNFVRDALHAWTISEHAFRPGVDSVRGALKTLRESGGLRDMMFAGASFMGGYVNAGDPGEVARAIRRALRARGYDAAAEDRYLATLLDTPARFWEKYRSVGDAIENANREATFEATLRATGSTTEAAYQAKDLMDYSMRGNWTLFRLMGDVLPFFNARLQGLYKLGRAGALSRPQVLARGALIALFSLALLALNRDREDYEALEEWDKDANWHFWLPDGAGGTQHLRLPKPFEIGLLYGTVPERVARNLLGRDDTETSFERLLWAIRDTLAFDPVPQAVKPIAELYANRDSFTGRPIEGLADAGKRPFARYDETTSTTMRTLGAFTSEATGVSPKQLEHLWRGYLGALGAYALEAADIAVRWAEGAPPRAERRWDEVPVVRAFVRESPAFSTRYRTELYEMAREAEQLYRTVRALREEGRAEEARALAEASSEKLKARPGLRRATEAMSHVRAQMDRVQRAVDMSAEEKRARLDELIGRRNEIAKAAVERAGAAFSGG